jgi:hypothetical protein
VAAQWQIEVAMAQRENGWIALEGPSRDLLDNDHGHTVGCGA